MNKIKLVFRTSDDEGMENYMEFNNAVGYQAGHGVVQIREHDGRTHMFNIPDFARIEAIPLTEEEILNSENKDFANWYKGEMEKAEARQAEANTKEGGEAATDAA